MHYATNRVLQRLVARVKAVGQVKHNVQLWEGSRTSNCDSDSLERKSRIL